MNYGELLTEAKELRQKVDDGKDSREKLSEMLSKMTGEPPHSPVYYRFYADKWSDEYAVNVLLHFIEMKGLSQEVDEFIATFTKREDYE